MKFDIESLLNTRWVGVGHATLIILSFALPWVYPEDYGNTVSVFGIALTTGSELSTFGDIMGFLFAAAIMTVAAYYLLHRWYGHVAVKTSVTMFAMVALYPIIAAGAIEKIWLGYAATLLLCAPTQTIMFVDWAHQKLEPHGGLHAVIAKIYGFARTRIHPPSGNTP